MQYCVVRIDKLSNVSQTYLGVCVPQECSSQELTTWLRPPFRGLEILVECEPNAETSSILPMTTIIVVGLIILVTIVSTVCEIFGFWHERDTLINAFSMVRNAPALLNLNVMGRDLKCLDGIRSLTMFWLVIYHTFRSIEYFTPAIVNPDAITNWQKSFSYSFIHYAPLAVDTFLLLGGILTAYKFMQDREKQRPFNYVYFLVHRWLRLTPVLISAIVFNLLVFRYVRGPNFFADFWLMNNYCYEYWWSALLYMQNIVNPLQPVSVMFFSNLKK